MAMSAPAFHLRSSFIPLLGIVFLALVAREAKADEVNSERLELVLPTPTIELGLGSVLGARPSAGQFFGLGKNEAGVIGAVDWQGGGIYDSDDSRRWRLYGEELGLDTRSLGVEYGQQGRYRLRLAYDQLPVLQSDSYQTPLLGARSADSTHLLLPNAFSARKAVGPSALPALSDAFANFAIGTRRIRSDLAFEAALNDFWQIKVSYRHDLKEGSKTTGALAGSVGGAVMILPEPINATTEQFSLSLAYAAQRRHLQVSYAGSMFSNRMSGLHYQNPFSAGQLENRLGNAPDNQFHQLKIDGSYNFSSSTRLSAAIAYGRMTQNQTFLPYSTNPLLSTLPQSSLHGLIVSESVNLKLTSRPWRDVSLLASYRYDERDNRTPVTAYTRSAYETGSASTQVNIPYSRSRSKASLEADYLLRRGSNLALGLERETIHRYCRQLPESCNEVERSTEDTLRAEWRQTFSNRISGKLAYSDSTRRANDGYTVLDPAAELAGMRKFLYADRDRRQLRSNLTLVASEALAFNARVDMNEDQYRQSRFGLTRADSRAGTLDASIAVNDDFSLYAFYTREDIHSRLANRYSGANQTTLELPANEWDARMHDTVDAIGLGVKHMGLISGRLVVSADLIFLQTASRYDITGGTCTGSACNGNLPSALPEVSSHQLTLKTDLRYEIDRESSVRLAGQFNYRRSKDYAYEGITAISSTRVLGTNEAPLNIDGHFVGLSYIHRFR